MSSAVAVRPDLPNLVTALPGPRAAEIIRRDDAVLSTSYTRGYPLVVDHGEGAVIEDVDGNRFLDFNAGIAVAATGHCHPKVVAAIQDQAARLIHMSGTDFYYENMVQLAEKLAALAPGNAPRRVYFGNSGTEAVEAAVKLARYHTKREKLVAFYGAFHGRTMGSLSLTASKAIQRKGFGSLVPGVLHAMYPDAYRCPGGCAPEQYASDCVRMIEDVMFRTIAPPDEIAAFIVEPIQGEGGYLVPPANFLPELQALARKHGILLICDEIQSGMGRTGKMWACEHFGIEPDIMTVAKGLASGMPLSAMIARSDIMNWPPGAHASTFGGNPVTIASALATIELVESELMDNARTVGAFMLSRMSSWQEKFAHVGQVRGKGLMIGVEIVRDQSTKERAPDIRDHIVLEAFARGLLILGAGQNTIRLCPPLLISEDQARFTMDTLEEVLRTLP